MLRITQSPTVQITTINLQGKLLAPWLDEVRAAVDAARTGGRVCVDLGELQFADHAGIVYLRGLRADDIELVRVSKFIEGLLAATSPV